MAADSDNFKKDPAYKKIRDGMVASGVREAGWNIGKGVGITALAGGVLFATGAVLDSTGIGIAIGVPLGLAGAAMMGFAGYKAWAAHKDAQMAVAEVTAERTAYHLSREQQQPAVDMTPDLTEKKFQDMLARRAATAQTRGQSV